MSERVRGVGEREREKEERRRERTVQAVDWQTGPAIRMAATVRVHNARQNPNVRDVQ